jgi:hypothetical protein
VRFFEGGSGVKRQSGVHFRRDSTGHQLQDAQPKLDRELIERRAGLLSQRSSRTLTPRLRQGTLDDIAVIGKLGGGLNQARDWWWHHAAKSAQFRENRRYLRRQRSWS